MEPPVKDITFNLQQNGTPSERYHVQFAAFWNPQWKLSVRREHPSFYTAISQTFSCILGIARWYSSRLETSWLWFLVGEPREYSFPGLTLLSLRLTSCMVSFLVPVPPLHYHSSAWIIIVFWPKVQVAGYSQTHMHSMYAALNKLTLSTGAWLYGVHRTCTKMAAAWCGTSH